MNFEPRTAASIGLPYLYHCQRFNLERVRSVIVDKKLHLSRPSAFNDPWDCKPCFDIDLSDGESVEAHAAYFERCDRKLNTHLGEAELAVRAKRLREDRPFLECCVRQMYGHPRSHRSPVSDLLPCGIASRAADVGSLCREPHRLVPPVFK